MSLAFDIVLPNPSEK